MTAPTPERLSDLDSIGPVAIRDLRAVKATVIGDAERFLAAAAIVGASVRRQIGSADLIALKREAKALGLLNFGDFERVAREAREQGADDDAGTRGPSQATRLVNLANSIYDFGITAAGDPFAVPREGGRIVRMLRGGRPPLRPELSAALFATEGIAPNGSALTDALAVLEGQAHQSDPVDLELRIARHQNNLLLDLGDATGRVVVITPDGWEIADRSPVLFRRTAATLPLPEPVGGQDLDDTLFNIVNVREDDRPLMKAVLAHYLWPDIGHVIARLTGRDGTAKTSATRILRSLIDPCAAPTRAMPKDETDWIVAVNAALIAAIDNVSAIPDWLSDAMCRACTGEGLMRRKLYSDLDVSILSARRIVLLNGIDATIKNADFARRVADFELQQITTIKGDSEVASEWAAAHPHALGALLDLAVTILKKLGSTVLAPGEASLTMHDFVCIAKTVSEPALNLYVRRLGSAAADIVDSDPFAGKLIGFLGSQPARTWTGLASELLAKIPAPEPLPRSWPKDATRFGVWARRLGRVLESAAGVRITKEERTSEGQPYTLELISRDGLPKGVGKSATPATQLQDGQATCENADVAGTVGERFQLHPPDQRGCSSVADVAGIPTEQDLAEEHISPTRAVALLQDRLGAELIETTPNGHHVGRCVECGDPLDSYFHAAACLGEGRAS